MNVSCYRSKRIYLFQEIDLEMSDCPGKVHLMHLFGNCQRFRNSKKHCAKFIWNRFIETCVLNALFVYTSSSTNILYRQIYH